MSEKYFLWYAICLQGQVCYSDSKSQESKMESILIKFKDSQLHSTKSLQLCLTLCNPMDCSLPGSSVHGILQAGILQRFAISFSRGSSCLRDWNLTSSDFYSSGSIAQLYPTLCYPMDCSKPGFHFHLQLPEFAQIHVHRIGDAIQLSHPLSSSSPSFNLSQHQGLF